MRYILFSALLLAGCEPSGGSATNTFSSSDCDYKMVVVVDMTPSFAKLMADQGAAYDFLIELIDCYFRDRIGSHDRIIIAQISANRQPLIWEGTPDALREQFDPQNFKHLLLDHSDPDGDSPVHECTVKTLEYLINDPSVAVGTAKPGFFILSDMDDNFPKSPEKKERLLNALRAYGKLNGAFGIYYCDQRYVEAWKHVLAESGIKQNRVVCDIVSRPDLPNFE